jgi:hypothetical protein
MAATVHILRQAKFVVENGKVVGLGLVWLVVQCSTLTHGETANAYHCERLS